LYGTEALREDAALQRGVVDRGDRRQEDDRKAHRGAQVDGQREDVHQARDRIHPRRR
jgi:hypothetical protein